MFKDFKTKLIILFVTLISSVQLITFLAVYNVTTHNVVTQIGDQLIYSGGTFKRHLDNQAKRLSESTTILASDYAFRKVVATGDKATIQSALHNHGARIKADRVILITSEKNIITDTGKSVQPEELEVLEQLIDIADAYDQAATMLVLDNTLYKFVVVPVLAPIPIAWIGIGIKLDSKVVSDLKSLFPLNLDISFIQRDINKNWNILASTLDTDLHAELKKSIPTLISQPGDSPINNSIENLLKINPPINTTLSGNDYVTISLPVGPQGRNSRVIALLQYPLATAMAAYQPLFFWVQILVTIGLLCTLLGGLLIGRNIIKPARTSVD